MQPCGLLSGYYWKPHRKLARIAWMSWMSLTSGNQSWWSLPTQQVSTTERKLEWPFGCSCGMKKWDPQTQVYQLPAWASAERYASWIFTDYTTNAFFNKTRFLKTSQLSPPSALVSVKRQGVNKGNWRLGYKLFLHTKVACERETFFQKWVCSKRSSLFTQGSWCSISLGESQMLCATLKFGQTPNNWIIWNYFVQEVLCQMCLKIGFYVNFRKSSSNYDAGIRSYKKL